MCVCIVCVYVCIHVMRVVRLRRKLTYCFFPFSWVDPTHSGGGGATNPEPGIIYILNTVRQSDFSPAKDVSIAGDRQLAGRWCVQETSFMRAMYIRSGMLGACKQASEPPLPRERASKHYLYKIYIYCICLLYIRFICIYSTYLLSS